MAQRLYNPKTLKPYITPQDGCTLLHLAARAGQGELVSRARAGRSVVSFLLRPQRLDVPGLGCVVGQAARVVGRLSPSNSNLGGQTSRIWCVGGRAARAQRGRGFGFLGV
jgi:hypothetical protein